MTRLRPAATGYQASDQVLEAMRARVRAGARNTPGVYRMLGPDGEVLYIGKSKHLRTRLLSYFRCDFPEEKGARLLREAADLDWEYVPNEFAALLREMRLVKAHRPRFNVALKRDARHYAFIKVSGGMAPKLLVVRGPAGDDSAIYYGPFFGAVQLSESLRELSDVLGLRDCALDQKMYFSDQGELFTLPARTPGCLRYETNKCLGPCIAACSAAAYTARVNAAPDVNQRKSRFSEIEPARLPVNGPRDRRQVARVGQARKDECVIVRGPHYFAWLKKAFIVRDVRWKSEALAGTIVLRNR
jgi:excinuclease ABC subunit C